MANIESEITSNNFAMKFRRYKSNPEFMKKFVAQLSHYQTLSYTLQNIGNFLYRNDISKGYYYELKKLIKLIQSGPKMLEEAYLFIDSYERYLESIEESNKLKEKKAKLEALANGSSNNKKQEIANYYKNPDIEELDDNLSLDEKEDRLSELLYRRRNGVIDGDKFFAEFDLDDIDTDEKRK